MPHLNATKPADPQQDFAPEPPPHPGPEAADARTETGPDVKRPLIREAPHPRPFPLDALGSLAAGAEAIRAITQAPAAICAQSVLATAALAICAHRDIESPISRRPLNGLFIAVAESGERKSAADRLALRPVHRIEREWRDQADAEAGTYKNAKEAWDEARSAAKRRAKGDRAAMIAAFQDIGPEPRAPRSPMLLVADATPEAIALHLADGRPWGGQFTAEGGLVVGGVGMSDDNRMRAGAFYNCLWDGDAIRRSRAMARSAYLPGRRFTGCLMMQPNVAAALLCDDILTQLGTVSRLLVVAPASTAGTRLYREPPPEAWRALDAYSDRIETWLRRTPRTESDSPDVLDPFPLTLDHDARALWVRFHDAGEAELRADGELAAIRAWGSKLPEHALRLAGLLGAIDDPDTPAISRDAMARGIVLAQHYASEMLRMAGAAAVEPDLDRAMQLLAWWQGRADPRCYLAAIYQTGPNALRDAATARRIVTVLMEHGWVKALPPGTEIEGLSRREAWELVP